MIILNFIMVYSISSLFQLGVSEGIDDWLIQKVLQCRRQILQAMNISNTQKCIKVDDFRKFRNTWFAVRFNE